MLSVVSLLLGVGVVAASFVVILISPVIIQGLWEAYYLLSIYDPTPEYLAEYRPDADSSEYIVENWFQKFKITYLINFISSLSTLLIVFVYGFFILDIGLSFASIFGTASLIVAINSALRIADKVSIRSGEHVLKKSDITLFGYSFYTSLWVLTILGGIIAVLNGSIGSSASTATFGSVYQALYWAGIWFFLLVTIPLCTEYFLAEITDLKEAAIDFRLTDVEKARRQLNGERTDAE